MNKLPILLLAASVTTGVATGVQACEECGGKMTNAAAVAPKPLSKTPDLTLTGASVSFLPAYDMLVFEQRVQGIAGRTKPKARGQMNGAPVVGYVFPTTLKSQDVGFSATAGVVVLAVTSHPDFDDSPLWDENGNGKTGDDGLVYHTHWVVLVPDKRVPGGLSVKEFKPAQGVVVPPTAPKMPMMMDSPGYAVKTNGNTLRVMVPASRIKNRTGFKFDAVTAYMEVSTARGKPMLGVYQVYSVLSGNLSLPYSVTKR